MLEEVQARTDIRDNITARWKGVIWPRMQREQKLSLAFRLEPEGRLTTLGRDKTPAAGICTVHQLQKKTYYCCVWLQCWYYCWYWWPSEWLWECAVWLPPRMNPLYPSLGKKGTSLFTLKVFTFVNTRVLLKRVNGVASFSTVMCIVKNTAYVQYVCKYFLLQNVSS